MEKFYLQVQNDGTITDCITFPHGNYVEYIGEVPQGVYGGWFKLEDGVIVEYPELKLRNDSDRIAELEQV